MTLKLYHLDWKRTNEADEQRHITLIHPLSKDDGNAADADVTFHASFSDDE